MERTWCVVLGAVAAALWFPARCVAAEEPARRSDFVLVDAERPLPPGMGSATDAQLSQSDGRVRVATGHTAERPGVTFLPPGGRWDLTGWTELQTTVRNLAPRALTVHLSVDNPGSNRAERQNCCIESVTIPPGEQREVKLKIRARVPAALQEKLRGMRGTPGGFVGGGRGTIDPADVAGISIYVYRPSSDCVLEVSSLRAGGSAAFPLPERMDDLFPMIDCFGQYMHKDWPGKTHSDDDLAAERQREAADLASHPGPSQWNQYGGWLGGPKLEATGRFRVAKWGGRWWFVDPEGRLYWSHGLVRVTWSCGYTPMTGREHLFAELPSRDTAFAPFYGQSTWAVSGLYPRGTETFNFSGANLLRKYGPGWADECADVAHRRLRSWGLNTLANCSQPAIYLRRKTPYTATVYSVDSPPEDAPGATGYVATIHDDSRVIAGTSGGWGQFPDVFDPSFKATLLEEIAQHRGKAVGDPWCLGYFPGNELNWGADETSLARAVLASPADQPAKRVLIEQLKSKYESIERLNAAWKAGYASWDAMLRATTPPEQDQGREDLSEFLGTIAETYFRQCREAVKQIDPDGLYLGCRFAGSSHGVVFCTAAKYSDVVSVNRYTETLDDFRLPEEIDKPVLIGEWHFGALDRGKFHAGLREVPSQQARGEAYEKYVASALAHPLVVGTHWHQYGDQATTGRDDGENFQNGFVDVCDTPYVETVEACRKIGYRLYDIRARQAGTPEILTPPPAPEPRINGAKVFGVRPGHPLLYTIAATGRRPMTFGAANLPEGLQLDVENGRISGTVAGRGTYRVMLRAENALGSTERELRIVVGDDICLTPLLGCNTWGGWGPRVAEEHLRAAAEAMVKSGLINHGWQYVNIDDGWQGRRGGKYNAIQPNEKFRDMRALCDYIHGMGLKAGIYSTPWTTSYAGFIGGSSDDPEGAWERPNKPSDGWHFGKHFFETSDARQWAEWGFDYVKYDWEVDRADVTRRMADALASCDRDIVLELSNSVPLERAAEHTALVQLSRTTGDLVDLWDRSQMDSALRRWAVGIREVWLAHDAWAPQQRPGHWNHACNLRVGLLGGWRNQPLEPSRLTPDEQYSHISLWCLWGSPMIIGTPIERLDPFTLSLLSNDEMLDVNQDPLGKQGRQTEAEGGEAVVKELEDGTRAVGLFNPGAETSRVAITWAKLGLAGPQRVRDLWRQKDLGIHSSGFFAEIAPHGVVVVRVSPAAPVPGGSDDDP